MINFNNAELLQYSQESQFFGENVMRYRVIKNIEVDGYLLDLSNTEGVFDIVSAQKAFASSANDWENFIINGIDFGAGIVNNYSFQEGNDVTKKRYKVSLTIYEDGNLNNLPTNGFYTGVDYTNFSYIDNLDENISWNNQIDQKSYVHEISVKILSNNRVNSINKAKAIASNLFSLAGNLTGLAGTYSNLSTYQPIYIEDYDELNASCSFSKTIDLLATTNGDYSINKSYRFTRGDDGISSVTEIGEIIALNPDYLNVLANAMITETAFSFANTTTIYNAYKSANEYNFSSQPIVRGTNLNKFDRTLNYEITFTNNPKTNSSYYLEYGITTNYEPGGIITTSENGKIIGFGPKGTSKYNLAVGGLSSVAGTVNSRLQNEYNNFKSKFDITYPGKFILSSKTEGHNPYAGFVEYNYNYTNDNTFNNGAIIQSDVVISKQYVRPINTDFTVFQYKEINQLSISKDISIQSASVTLKGKRNTSMGTYLSYAKGLVPGDIKTNLISSARYSLDPYANKFNLTVEWIKIYT